MREENGLLFFDTKQEEKEKIEKDFKGIFVRVHPDVFYYTEILEIISKEKIQRPLGITDIIDYCDDSFVPNVQEAIKHYKDMVIKIVSKNYPPAIENRIPKIAISVELENRLFGSYKSKK